MKKNKIAFWIFTILICGLMVFSAIPGLKPSEDSIKLISTQMGYPKYFIPFISVAKLLAVVVILIPGFPRLKEWAYAGLAFDLVGAWYSTIALGTPISGWIFFVLFLGLLFGSYIFYHKLQKPATAATYGRQ